MSGSFHVDFHRQTVFYTPSTLTVSERDTITGTLACAPNARNNRDLDISISYKTNVEPETTVHYKMCVFKSRNMSSRSSQRRMLTCCQVLIDVFSLLWFSLDITDTFWQVLISHRLLVCIVILSICSVLSLPLYRATGSNKSQLNVIEYVLVDRHCKASESLSQKTITSYICDKSPTSQTDQESTEK